jgi:carbon-monoxide dehydrogenase medium subunit
LIQVRKRLVTPAALISIRGIPELTDISNGRGLRLGAAACLSDVMAHAEVQEHYPVLVEAASSLGSPQIRNVATLGGNLGNASPCANMAPPLLVLDARLELRSPQGSREVPLQEFFLGPGETCLRSGEVVAAALVDPPSPGVRAGFWRKGRVQMDLAVASLAVLLELEEGVCRRARVAAGSVAPLPLRLREVERLLEGQEITEPLRVEAGRLAASSVRPITDVRGSEAYRRQLIDVFMRRALARLAGAE